MSNTNKIPSINPIKIDTTYASPILDAGMSGVMLINPSNSEGLQTYHNVNSLIKDYGQSSAIYAQAKAYFSNPDSPLFQVVSYKAGDTSSLNNVLKKYYYAGSQFFLVHMDITDKNISDISAMSNFVEAQDNKEIIMDLVYSDVTKLPDVLSQMHLAGNKSTYVIAKPYQNGVDEYFGAYFLAKYANAGLGIDAALVHDLDGVTIQDQYEFSSEQLSQYFTPNNVATYAFRGYPMMTSGKTQDGHQLQAMVVRDAITNEVVSKLLNVYVQNNGRITYDSAGVKLFEGAIHSTLQSYKDNNYIKSFQVKTIDVDKISDSVKATGELAGLGWSYEPVSTIDDATFSQTVILPEL